MSSAPPAINCPTCGRIVPPFAINCPSCGQPVPSQAAFANYPRGGSVDVGKVQVVPGSHHVALAIVLSVFFFGWIGMLVNHQVAKGLVWFAITFIVVPILAFVTCGLGLIVFPVIWIVQLVDVCMIAARLDRGEAVAPWQHF